MEEVGQNSDASPDQLNNTDQNQRNNTYNVGFGRNRDDNNNNNNGQIDDYSQYDSHYETKIETEKPENIVIHVYLIPWIERII